MLIIYYNVLRNSTFIRITLMGTKVHTHDFIRYFDIYLIGILFLEHLLFQSFKIISMQMPGG